jgi:hypothetical protein
MIQDPAFPCTLGPAEPSEDSEVVTAKWIKTFVENLNNVRGRFTSVASQLMGHQLMPLAVHVESQNSQINDNFMKLWFWLESTMERLSGALDCLQNRLATVESFIGAQQRREKRRETSDEHRRRAQVRPASAEGEGQTRGRSPGDVAQMVIDA